MTSIRLLRSEDNPKAFQSGNDDLDRFFRRYAARNQYQLHIGVTYVAVASDHILGFVTMAVGSVQADELPPALARQLPGYPLPILRLARLAVDLRHQRKGIGTALVRFTLLKAIELDRELGCLGVVVDPKPESVPFYLRLGFEPLEVIEGERRGPTPPLPHFLHIEPIRRSIQP